MLGYFQTEDDRELAVACGQVVVSGTGMELQVGMGAIRLGDAFGRWINAGHIPAAPGQFVRNRAVAAAEFEQSTLIGWHIQPVQQTEHGG